MMEFDRYAVIGNPINHSQSPRIHAAFAAQTKQALKYERILGDLKFFSSQVQEFFAAGGCGLNITLPFKQEAWKLATKYSSRAKAAEAANTLLCLSDGAIFADNTDGPGLVRDLLHNHNVSIAQRAILLLGAGGAARGVLLSLLEQKPRLLWIVNRTASKAIALIKLANNYPDICTTISGGGLELIATQRFDIIINATSASLAGTTPPVPDNCLTPNGVVYDMLYADHPTPFVRWGVEHGAGVAVDGFGMLVEQAAESFWLWRGVRPDTKVILPLLRSVVLNRMG